MARSERRSWLRPWHSRRPDDAQPERSEATRRAGERRQLTVMFVDAVGSTAMAEQHEPEVVRDVLRAYQDVAGRAIDTHGGYIFRYLGDGIMVYFGFPSAREDDARHAVLTGLEIIESLAGIAPAIEREHGIELAARVGIHTGLVLMSDMGSGSARQPDAAVGPAPNEAARLQSFAPPGGVVISDDTYEIVRGYFDVEPLGTPELKGIERPVEVYRVLGPTGAVQRLQARGAARTPFVGRHTERRALREIWDALLDMPATSMRVRTVTLLGEAGIGKSRLAEATTADAVSSGGTLLSAFCASDRQGSRFFPVIGMLERSLDIQAADDARTRAAKVEAGCRALRLDIESTAPFVMDVLGLAAESPIPLPELDPHQIRERTFDALSDLVRARARRGRVLLLVDDVQWADQTTLEWLTRIASLESTLPVMLLAVARPEFSPPWTGPMCRVIALGRLEHPDHSALIRELAELYDIPESMWQAIADRSDGNPLFTEELAKSIGRSDRLRRSEVIPTTIRDLLTARLDALGVQKELAQVASVMGRDIDVELLAAVTGLSPKQLSLDLTDLARTGILEAASEDVSPTQYRFVHALVRDAAYESQEQGDARGTHLRVADALASRPSVDPGLVAQHFDAAAAADQAVAWYLLAGAAAQESAADAEAIRYLDRGLELLPRLEASPGRDILEFNLHLARGSSYVSTQGYSAPGAVADFRRGLELSDQVAAGMDALPATAAIWAYYLVHGDLRSAADAIERLTAMSRPEFEPEVHSCVGVQQSFEGRFPESLETLTRSVDAMAARGRGAPTRWLLPHDPFAVALVHLGLALALVGETEAADERLEQAMHVAQSLPDYPTGAFSVAYVASYWGLVASFSGEHDQARLHHEHALAVAERFELQFWISAAMIGRAVALGHLGDPHTALEMLAPALEQWQKQGGGALVPYDMTARGFLHLQTGELAAALADVDGALALSERTTERIFSAETHRVKAAVLLAIQPDDVDAARRELEQARGLAGTQGALLFELRAAIELCELPGGDADRDATVLRDVLDRLPAGTEGHEVERARALLSR